MLRHAVSVAVGVAAAACLVLAVACEDEGAKPQATGGAQSPTPARPQRIVTATPGVVAEAEGIRITFLEKVDPWTEYGQFEEPPAGNVYVAIRLAMENVGKRDHSLWPSNFALKTSSFDGEVIYSKAEPDLFATGPFLTLSKGSRAEGWVTFTVAQGAQLKLLKYDPDPFTTDDIEFQFQGNGTTATATAQVAVPEQQRVTPTLEAPKPIRSLEPTPTPEAMPTLMPAPERTEVIIAQPPATPTREVMGSCWGPSSGAHRPNAWRCAEEDGQIHDPCFSQGDTDAFVICLTGEKINLTAPLPASYGWQDEDPSQALILELVDGTTCAFVQGATAVVDGERVNYSCSDGGWVVGFPETGQVWIARKVWFSEPLEPPYEPTADTSVAVTRAVR